jgi:hypothetical protein
MNLGVSPPARKGSIMRLLRCVGTAAAALTVLAAIVAIAPATARPPLSDRHPFELLSRTPAGAALNAPATEPALSGDSRIARYAAYVSAATNVVAGSGGYRNLYVVQRAGPWGQNGTFWRQGATMLISRGLGGQPANGDSWGASFDGYEYGTRGHVRVKTPNCVAFVSAASNLVPRDNNGRADVFVRRLPNGGLTRIAARQPVTAVAMDGWCKQLAYIAGGTLYTQAANGRGRARRASPPGGASHPDLSGNGKVATFERNGWVYVSAKGRARRLTPGTEPSANAYGTYAAFTRGGQIFNVTLQGRPHVEAVAQYPSGVVRGEEPTMSAGHSFVFYVDGQDVRSNGFATSMGRCETGAPHQPALSGHGNYVAYACSGAGVYLTYVGPK